MSMKRRMDNLQQSAKTNEPLVIRVFREGRATSEPELESVWVNGEKMTPQQYPARLGNPGSEN